MPVCFVVFSLGKNRGSIRNWAPTVPREAFALTPTCVNSDSPIRVTPNDWPILPVGQSRHSNWPT